MHIFCPAFYQIAFVSANQNELKNWLNFMVEFYPFHKITNNANETENYNIGMKQKKMKKTFKTENFYYSVNVGKKL